MCRYWRPNVTLGRCGSAAGALLILLGLAITSRAAVTVTGDPADRYGLNPNVFTFDPFTLPAAERANRGVANTRKLRQSFKNPTTFNVGQINISFDVTGGTPGGAGDTGLRIAIYELADVNVSWVAGNLVNEFIVPIGGLPASNQVLRFDLTEGNVFSLPARFDGTTGYGIEISTPMFLATDGNPGVLWYTIASAYADGGQFAEGGGYNARDVGLSLIGSNASVCDPGDVNCMGGVTIADLEIIAANFRKNGSREMGDLTGNGFIDFDDFGQWKQNYMGPGLGAEAFAFLTVPEPGSLMLLVTGVAGAFVRPRRRHFSNYPE